jgi:hypothetical protein
MSLALDQPQRDSPKDVGQEVFCTPDRMAVNDAAPDCESSKITPIVSEPLSVAPLTVLCQFDTLKVAEAAWPCPVSRRTPSEPTGPETAT